MREKIKYIESLLANLPTTGGVETIIYASASDNVAGSVLLDEALGWHDPVLAKSCDAIVIYTNLPFGPEAVNPAVAKSGWWYVTTRELMTGYFTRAMFSDYGDFCVQCFALSNGAIVENNEWQVFAKSDIYWCERIATISNGNSGPDGMIYEIGEGDIAFPVLYNTGTNIESYKIPKAGSDTWIGGGLKFLIVNHGSENIEVISDLDVIINGVTCTSLNGTASNNSVAIPKWGVAELRVVYPNVWVVSILSGNTDYLVQEVKNQLPRVLSFNNTNDTGYVTGNVVGWWIAESRVIFKAGLPGFQAAYKLDSLHTTLPTQAIIGIRKLGGATMGYIKFNAGSTTPIAEFLADVIIAAGESVEFYVETLAGVSAITVTVPHYLATT